MSINVWDPESANMNPYWVTQSRSQVLSNFLLLMYVFMIVCSGAYLILWGRSITAFIATAGPAQYWPILSMAIFSLISHTFSFVYNFILGGERNTVAMSYIFRRTMVGRMLPLFLSTFISFFSVGITGSNSKSAMIPLVVIFGAVAFFDILAHFNEHKKS